MSSLNNWVRVTPADEISPSLRRASSCSPDSPTRNPVSDTVMFKHIWILDDDPFQLKILSNVLSSPDIYIKGFDCTEAMLKSLHKTKDIPDAFVVDFHLRTSRHNGLSVCRTLVQLYQRPVVILTDDRSVERAIACLEAGADDYVHKSCNMKELKARVLARLRKQSDSIHATHETLEASGHTSGKINYKTLTLDTLEKTLHCSMVSRPPIPISSNECKILAMLMKAPDKIVQRGDAYFALYERVQPPYNRVIDITISRIRKHLSTLGALYSIRSLRFRGYRLTSTYENK
jgi:DNA-binding response OmpR family regulator